MKKIISLLTVMLVFSGMLAVPAKALENVALNKPTAASSVYAEGTTGPANINDGNRSNYFASGGAVLEGTVNGNQFVRIDLQETYDIDSVVLYTRVDMDDGRYRKNFALEFSNTVDFAEKESIQAVGNEPVGFKESVTVDLNLKRPYRYVRVVQSAGDSLLVLAEVEVFGEAASLSETGDIIPPEYADAAASDYAGPIRLLQTMGIMAGIDETTFGVNKIVSRAQAADAIVRAANPGFPQTKEQPFSDVDSTFWAADTISRAWSMGVIKGDGSGNFRPNDPVSELEAITMMLRALGYGEFLEARNSVSQTIAAAKQAGLVKSFQADKNEYIGRGKFAQMLYRMLLSNVAAVKEINGEGIRYETRKCLLEDQHGILLYEGLVKQNRYSHLSQPKADFGNDVCIGADTFLDPNGVLDDLLGYNITYAVKKDQPEQIFIAWQEDNEVVSIQAEELNSSVEDIKNGMLHVLYADNKKERFTLAKARDTILNGVSYPEALPEDLLIPAGEIILIDNDNDGSYDVVDIHSYEVIEISLVAEMGEELAITGTHGQTKTLIKEHTSVRYISGAEAKTSKIKSGRVIRLYQSTNGLRSEAVLLDKTVSGTVETITYNESVTVGGQVYEYAAILKNSGQEEFSPGDFVVLYLDEANKAEWILKDMDEQSSDWVIGFSQKVNLAKNMGDKTQFRIFNQNGSFETLTVADKIFVDGTRMDHDELTDTIKTDQTNFVLDFIRYQTNDNGEINRIDTMYKGTNEDTETMSFYRESTGGSLVTEVNAVYNAQTYVMPAKSDTLTFVIPQIDGEYTDNEEYDYVYEIKQLSQVLFNHNDNGDTTVSSYMLGEDGFPKFFANIKNYKGGGSDLNVRLVSDTANMPVLLVESVNKAVLDDTDGYYINGRNLKTGKEEKYFAENNIKLFETGKVFQEKQEWLDANMWLDESQIFNSDTEILQNYVSDFTELSFGDIIGCESASDRVTAIERLYNYDKTAMPELLNSVWYSGGQHPKWFFSLTRLQVGSVEEINKDAVTFKPKEGVEERFYLSSFFSTLYVCDNNRETILTENGANISAYTNENMKFMYLCSAGTPVCIIAYTYDS